MPYTVSISVDGKAWESDTSEDNDSNTATPRQQNAFLHTQLSSTLLAMSSLKSRIESMFPKNQYDAEICRLKKLGDLEWWNDTKTVVIEIEKQINDLKAGDNQIQKVSELPEEMKEMQKLERTHQTENGGQGLPLCESNSTDKIEENCAVPIAKYREVLLSLHQLQARYSEAMNDFQAAKSKADQLQIRLDEGERWSTDLAESREEVATEDIQPETLLQCSIFQESCVTIEKCQTRFQEAAVMQTGPPGNSDLRQEMQALQLAYETKLVQKDAEIKNYIGEMMRDFSKIQMMLDECANSAMLKLDRIERYLGSSTGILHNNDALKKIMCLENKDKLLRICCNQIVPQKDLGSSNANMPHSKPNVNFPYRTFDIVSREQDNEAEIPYHTLDIASREQDNENGGNSGLATLENSLEDMIPRASFLLSQEETSHCKIEICRLESCLQGMVPNGVMLAMQDAVSVLLRKVDFLEKEMCTMVTQEVFDELNLQYIYAMTELDRIIEIENDSIERMVPKQQLETAHETIRELRESIQVLSVRDYAIQRSLQGLQSDVEGMCHAVKSTLAHALVRIDGIERLHGLVLQTQLDQVEKISSQKVERLQACLTRMVPMSQFETARTEVADLQCELERVRKCSESMVSKDLFEATVRKLQDSEAERDCLRRNVNEMVPGAKLLRAEEDAQRCQKEIDRLNAHIASMPTNEEILASKDQIEALQKSLEVAEDNLSHMVPRALLDAVQDTADKAANMHAAQLNAHPVAVGIQLDCDFVASAHSGFVALDSGLEEDISIALGVPSSSISVLGHQMCHEQGSMIAEIALGTTRDQSARREHQTPSELAVDLLHQARDENSVLRSMPMGQLARNVELHGLLSTDVCTWIERSHRAILEMLMQYIKCQSRMVLKCDFEACQEEAVNCKVEATRLQRLMDTMVPRATVDDLQHDLEHKGLEIERVRLLNRSIIQQLALGDASAQTEGLKEKLDLMQGSLSNIVCREEYDEAQLAIQCLQSSMCRLVAEGIQSRDLEIRRLRSCMEGMVPKEQLEFSPCGDHHFRKKAECGGSSWDRIELFKSRVEELQTELLNSHSALFESEHDAAQLRLIVQGILDRSESNELMNKLKEREGRLRRFELDQMMEIISSELSDLTDAAIPGSAAECDSDPRWRKVADPTIEFKRTVTVHDSTLGGNNTPGVARQQILQGLLMIFEETANVSNEIRGIVCDSSCSLRRNQDLSLNEAQVTYALEKEGASRETLTTSDAKSAHLETLLDLLKKGISTAVFDGLCQRYEVALYDLADHIDLEVANIESQLTKQQSVALQTVNKVLFRSIDQSALRYQEIKDFVSMLLLEVKNCQDRFALMQMPILMENDHAESIACQKCEDRELDMKWVMNGQQLQMDEPHVLSEVYEAEGGSFELEAIKSTKCESESILHLPTTQHTFNHMDEITLADSEPRVLQNCIEEMVPEECLLVAQDEGALWALEIQTLESRLQEASGDQLVDHQDEVERLCTRITDLEVEISQMLPRAHIDDEADKAANMHAVQLDACPVAVGIQLDCDFVASAHSGFVALDSGLQEDISIALGVPSSSISVLGHQLCHEQGSMIAEIALGMRCDQSARREHQTPSKLAINLLHQTRDENSVLRSMPIGGLVRNVELHGLISVDACRTIELSHRALLDMLKQDTVCNGRLVPEYDLGACQEEALNCEATPPLQEIMASITTTANVSEKGSLLGIATLQELQDELLGSQAKVDSTGDKTIRLNAALQKLVSKAEYDQLLEDLKEREEQLNRMEQAIDNMASKTLLHQKDQQSSTLGCDIVTLQGNDETLEKVENLNPTSSVFQREMILSAPHAKCESVLHEVIRAEHKCQGLKGVVENLFPLPDLSIGQNIDIQRDLHIALFSSQRTDLVSRNESLSSQAARKCLPCQAALLQGEGSGMVSRGVYEELYHRHQNTLGELDRLADIEIENIERMVPKHQFEASQAMNRMLQQNIDFFNREALELVSEMGKLGRDFLETFRWLDPCTLDRLDHSQSMHMKYKTDSLPRSPVGKATWPDPLSLKNEFDMLQIDLQRLRKENVDIQQFTMSLLSNRAQFSKLLVMSSDLGLAIWELDQIKMSMTDPASRKEGGKSRGDDIPGVSRPSGQLKGKAILLEHAMLTQGQHHCGDRKMEGGQCHPPETVLDEPRPRTNPFNAQDQSIQRPIHSTQGESASEIAPTGSAVDTAGAAELEAARKATEGLRWEMSTLKAALQNSVPRHAYDAAQEQILRLHATVAAVKEFVEFSPVRAV